MKRGEKMRNLIISNYINVCTAQKMGINLNLNGRNIFLPFVILFDHEKVTPSPHNYV